MDELVELAEKGQQLDLPSVYVSHISTIRYVTIVTCDMQPDVRVSLGSVLIKKILTMILLGDGTYSIEAHWIQLQSPAPVIPLGTVQLAAALVRYIYGFSARY